MRGPRFSTSSPALGTVCVCLFVFIFYYDQPGRCLITALPCTSLVTKYQARFHVYMSLEKHRFESFACFKSGLLAFLWSRKSPLHVLDSRLL